MLTAHLPSGYVAARSFAPGLKWGMPVALIAAILPDVDLLWFYLIDDRSVHHHKYWFHIPLFWALIALATWPVARRAGIVSLYCLFFGVLLLHMALDTIVGGIAWLQPFSDHLITLVTVPAVQDHWVLNFVFHWTFLLELLIWAAALALLLKGRHT
ncbi:MAG: metal-dependent hydrolase [Silicimonas sp.]|nr:metal-dependent hydrolase [Silicimonas sp.]